jgi:hypothetical protein
MPMHDWTRVNAGTYHDFHGSWLADIKNRLNEGLLPGDHYALTEQIMESMTADILTLREEPPPPGPDEDEGGGLALALAPPQVRFTQEIEEDLYAARTKRLVIRHSSDGRMVAMVELISPGNKSGDHAFGKFVEKSLEALDQGIHLLIIDPFPPTPRDPKGIHAAIWGELGGKFEPPADKPLTMAAYLAGLVKKAYIEPFAVGDALTPMPLFLSRGRYVPLPLEESYARTFRGVPRRYREVLEGGGPAS